MKNSGTIVLLSVMIVLTLPACYIVRESDRSRDDYFQPVAVLPQRSHPTLSSTEMEQLRIQLESATAAAIMLRDSLASLQKYTGLLLVSTRSLVDKVSELEAREFLSDTKQKDIERNIAELQLENKKLSQQLEELHAQFVSGKVEMEPSYPSKMPVAPSFRNEYNEGLLLFHQRRYEDASGTFGTLLEKGIEEDLADNCEYWMGECYFARREYRKAINQFQKVLTIESSNKKADALFMLGRSNEYIGDLIKARWAYGELNTHYPNNEHAVAVKSRLEALKRILTAPQPSAGKKGKSTV
jgi:TolA-binding protein